MDAKLQQWMVKAEQQAGHIQFYRDELKRFGTIADQDGCKRAFSTLLMHLRILHDTLHAAAQKAGLKGIADALEPDQQAQLKSEFGL